jgi:hypothetical protein
VDNARQESPADRTPSGGGTRWTYLKLTQGAFFIYLSQRLVPRIAGTHRTGRCCASWNLDDGGDFHAHRPAITANTEPGVLTKDSGPMTLSKRMSPVEPVNTLISQRCHRTQKPLEPWARHPWSCCQDCLPRAGQQHLVANAQTCSLMKDPCGASIANFWDCHDCHDILELSQPNNYLRSALRRRLLTDFLRLYTTIHTCSKKRIYSIEYGYSL